VKNAVALPNKGYLDSSSQEKRVLVSSWRSCGSWLHLETLCGRRTDCKRICGLFVGTL
jgi:hypothetical protein